jgi:uncharacterized protein
VLWISISIIIGILVIDLLIHIIFALIVTPVFEHKPPFHAEPVQESDLAEKIRINSSNDLTLSGSLYRSSKSDSDNLIIFCPEFGSSHWSASRYCQGLIDAGFHVLSFDFRNQGESDSLQGYAPLHWMTHYELQDVLSVIQYIKNDPELSEMNLGIFGISRGGSAAIAAAVHYPEIKKVAVEGLFSASSLSLHFTLRWASLYAPAWVLEYTPTWHVKMTLYIARRICGFRKKCQFLELETYLKKLKNRSIYLITGEQDSYVLPQISKGLIEQIDSENTEIWEVKGARHNMSLTVSPDEYDERLARFFLRTKDSSLSEKVNGNTLIQAKQASPDHHS